MRAGKACRNALETKLLIPMVSVKTSSACDQFSKSLLADSAKQRPYGPLTLTMVKNRRACVSRAKLKLSRLATAGVSSMVQ